MKISKAVGKNCFSQAPADVKLVQSALAGIKNKKFKSYYAGRIDGKCGNKTIEAISHFQCDNSLKMTGKIEAYGPTMNKLRMKTPMSLKNKLANSGGGGMGAGGTLDINRVKTNNKNLADKIKKTWSLPKLEGESLAKLVEAVTMKGMVPLRPFGNEPVGIDPEGRFKVRFDIEPWALDNSVGGMEVRRSMTKAVADVITTSPYWHRGDPTILQFKSAQAYKDLKGGTKPSSQFLRYLGIQEGSITCPCLLAIASGAQNLVQKEMSK